MKILQQRIDLYLLAVIGLSLFTLIPLLSNIGLPNGSDVLYHTYRVGEMDRSWTHGVLFPRWAEGLYFGYGSPLFHFYASLTYTITSVLLRLFDFTALDALRAVIVGCMVGGSVGMYALMKARVGRLAGVLSAVTFIYSPYILYTEPYARGTYPELLALCWFPFILWGFDRFLITQRARDFVLASVSLFLLILAHNLMALTLTAWLIAWLLWGGLVTFMEVYRQAERDWLRLRPHGMSLVAVGVGLGLAGYFWIPVLMETDSVNLSNLTAVALLDFRNFFAPMDTLLSPAPIQDAGAINGLKELTILGVASWLLAGIGALLALIFAVRGKINKLIPSYTLFFGLTSLIMIFLITPASLFLWEGINALSLLQFPWRLLGPVAIGLAILAGMNAVWLVRLPKRVGIGLMAGAVALPIALAMPLFFVPEWRNTQVDTSISAYHQAEVQGLQLGTTFTNEYRPRDVFTLADPTDFLLADYADGYPIDKLSPTSLPEGATSELLANSPEFNQWRIASDEAFTMEVLIHAWSGWSATVDGESVEITPSNEHGLITLPVPAGEHVVTLTIGTTPAMVLGNTVSVMSLGIGLVVVLLLSRVAWGASPTPLEKNDLGWGVALGGVLAVVAIALFYREGIAWVNSTPGTAEPAEVALNLNLDESFEALGYDLNGREFNAGDQLELTLYWYAKEATDVDFSSFLHVSPGGPPVAQIDKLHPGGRAVSEWWTPDGYILDTYSLTLPETLPAGEYQLYVGLYTCELMPADNCGNGYRPTVTTDEGEVIGDTLPLGAIIING